ncbi:MAG: protein phosphatase 2C domain-containing protein [Myxococcota bacterium]
MRQSLLRGREQLEIGAMAVEGEGSVAIGLSRGGAPKRYPHRDPNEDAALFAAGPGGVLLAVADAHDGEVAATAALEQLLDRAAPRWTAALPLSPDSWRDEVLAELVLSNGGVLEARRAGDTPDSCTTLTLAVVRPEQRLLLHASLGDSHLFQVGATGVVDHGARSSREARHALGSYFLGWGAETRDSLVTKCRIGADLLGDARAVVLATDGISERNIGLADPGAAVARCVREAAEEDPSLRPLRLTRRVVESALEAQARNRAGDNVGVAVFWCGTAS